MKIRPFALVLAVACASCEMPEGDLKDPNTWGQYFLDKYEVERQVGELEPGPEPLAKPRVVLLITGVTIPAEWFDPMKARLERDGFIPVVYEPPDLLSGDLFYNSELLAEVVDDVRAQTGQDKIDILAECTGGLIARHYIQSLGGDQYVSRMVTFISPQHGLPKAPMAADYAGWPALYDLSPGSDFLDAVNDAPLPVDVPVTSVYSCTDEYIQPFETSIIPGATNIGLCNGFVGHFQFFYDPAIYLVLHDALIQPAPSDADADPAPDDVDANPDPADDDASSDAGGAANAADASQGDAGQGCSVTGSSSGCSAAAPALGASALFASRRRRRCA